MRVLVLALAGLLGCSDGYVSQGESCPPPNGYLCVQPDGGGWGLLTCHADGQGTCGPLPEGGLQR